MLKKSITYDDYNGDSVTEDFYFNLTKLELLETEISQDGGLEKTIKTLVETENGPEAYRLFKTIILSAYGEKSLDGKRFVKTPELLAAFEQSPAMSEMIIEFLEQPESGAKFIESVLPPKLVAQVKATQAAQAAQEAQTPETPSDDNVTELLTVAPEESETTVEKNPQEMSREELMEAFRKKSQGE